MRNALSSPGIAVVIYRWGAGRDACGVIIAGPSQSLSTVDLNIGEKGCPVHQTAGAQGLPTLLRSRRLVRFEVAAERIPARLEFQSECEVRIIAPLHCIELATQRTEPEAIMEASATNLASVGDPLPRPGLRPRIEEHNLRAVDYVCLNPRYIDVLLNLIHPHHVVVRRSSYLNDAMVPVIVETVRAESISGAVQAEHVALALVGDPVDGTGQEVARAEHWLQPRQAQIVVSHSYYRTHHRFLAVGLEDFDALQVVVNMESHLVVQASGKSTQFLPSYQLSSRKIGTFSLCKCTKRDPNHPSTQD